MGFGTRSLIHKIKVTKQKEAEDSYSESPVHNPGLGLSRALAANYIIRIRTPGAGARETQTSDSKICS